MDKIFVITSNIAPYRLKWCEELARFFDVTIIYTKDHDYERDDRWLQKSSKSCKLYKLKNDDDKFDPLCFDVIDIIRDYKDALIIFDGYGPKTNLLGLLYCKITGRKSFVNVDGFPTERSKSWLRETVKKFVILRLCTGFFCSGELTKKHLISYGAKEERITVHNFSSIKEEDIIAKPLNRKQKMVVRKKLKLDTDKRIVLGVGRFLPLKRFEDLITAIRKCQSDCELYILGGQPLKEYLQLSEGADNIHFIDFVLPEEVKEYYKAADLFVLPSETDVWGLVLNEAMAQGIPIIASDSCVGAFSLIDGNGRIFETYNVAELSKDIDECLQDDLNKKMSERSLEIIHDFTIEGMVQRQLGPIKEYFAEI